MNYLKPNEIKACLSAIDETHNIWRAFMSMVEEAKGAEIDNVCLPNLTDTAGHFNRGRFSMINDFRNACENYMKEAQKIKYETDLKK